MSELVVSTAFTAKGDGVTSALVRQAKAADTLGTRLKTAFKDGIREHSRFVSNLGANLVSSAITKMTSQVSQGLQSAVTEFVSFDAAIRSAADTGKIELKPGTAAFMEFSQAARDLASSSKFSATAGAEALGKLGEAGFTASQAMSSLPLVAQLATGTGLDLAVAADVASSALQAFGLASSDSATLAKNLAQVNDILSMSADQSKMSAEDFTAAMKSSGPALSAAGMSLETYTALLGKMTLSGMDGADAGGKLNFMMKGLAAPSKAAIAATKSLGISMYDEKGQMRDLIDFIADYKTATEDQTDVQRNANTAVIFGRRGLDGVNTVLGLGVDELQAYRDELKNAGGTAKAEADVIEKSLGYKIDVLKNSAVELGMKLVEAFAGEGKNGIDDLIKSVKEFDMKPVIEGARTLLEMLKGLARFIRDHSGTIASIAATFVALKVAMAAVSFVKVIAGLGAVTTAATTASAATAAVGATGGVAGGVGAATGKGAAVANGAVPVLAAAGIGYSLGTYIEEEFLNPIRVSGEKMALQLNNLTTRMGVKDVGAMSQVDLVKNMQTIKGQLSAQTKTHAINSIEGAVAQVNSGLMGVSASVGEFFGFLTQDQAAAVVAANQGPIDIQRAQVEELSRIYMAMANAVNIARLQIETAAAKASTEINVNVANAPAGTTVDAKGTSGAPKVNQGAAGKV